MQLKTLAAATVLAATPVLAQDCLQITNTPPGTDLALGDDQTVSLPLPFAFPFNGTTYDAISICSNGYVWLGIETSADLSASESEFLSLSPRIAVCWDDINPNSTAVPVGGGVFFNQSASQVNIVFKDVPYFGSTTDFVNCEIVMTAAGFIHLHWEANHTIATGTSLVGVTAGNGALANPLDLSAATTIAGATGYEVFAAGTHDLLGTYSLIPTSATDYSVVQQTLPVCTPTTGPNLTQASTSEFGAGCPSPSTGTWFEFFPGSTLDLNGTSIRFIAAGNNLYAPTPGAGFDSSYTLADAVALADDGQVNVSVAAMGGFPFLGNTLTSIDMVSNGWFWMAPNTSNDYSPSIAEFASLEPRIAPCWMDLNPSATSGGGTVYWTETATFAMGTWEDVPTFGNTGTAMNTFQCKFYPNGDVEMTWVNVVNDATLDDNAIVGFSGGFSSPTASVDISAGTTGIFDITPDLTFPLTHVADTDPQLGQSYDLTTNDAPAGSLFGATFVGFTQQNIDLTPFGAPGCVQYADNLAVFFNVLNGAQTFTNSIPVPFSLSFVGISFVSQGAVYEPGQNALGVVSSNGVIGTIGL